MTRKEAINVLLNEKECVLRETCERLECASCELVMPVGNILSAYDVAIDALREQEERWWIPVTERLPENDNEVLTANRQTVQILFYDHDDADWYTVDSDNSVHLFCDNVTHWMPLPPAAGTAEGGVNMDELKPCPFCGSKNLTIVDGFGEKYVGCMECAAVGPSADTEKEAFDAWNRRVNDGDYQMST